MTRPRHLQTISNLFSRNSLRRHPPPTLLLLRPKIPTPSFPTSFLHSSSSSSSSDDLTDLRDRILLLTEKPTQTTTTHHPDLDESRSQIFSLADQLLAAAHLTNLKDDDDLTVLAAFLDSHSAISLLRRSPSGLALVELLHRLKTRPRLALQVFLWRLKLAETDTGLQLVPEEYAKAISLAGRSKKPNFARDLFTDAGRRGIRSTGMYNSLMAAYMYNSLASKAISVYEELKRDRICEPSIVTYNILLSVYGRLMLVDKLENVVKEIGQNPHISPNLTTYNVIIAGYLTAWMWDRMEKTYRGMMSGDVKPDSFTHCLMLRGYAHACNIEKMEEIYELVKDMVNKSVSPLVRAMICAYCKSDDKNRVSKIEGLIKHIPQGEYKSWLNVVLIRLYAQEGLLDAMERLIFEAVNREVRVIAIGVMRSIIASYFRCDSMDRLIKFIRLAECAGWRLCRSLYHCKMVMYGQRNQIGDMHGVLLEMENFRFDRTKNTFWIMYKAYSKAGRMSEAESVVGMMCKYGFLDFKPALLY